VLLNCQVGELVLRSVGNCREVAGSSPVLAATSEQEDKLKSDLMNAVRAMRYDGNLET
jgi:hypothetical protein